MWSCIIWTNYAIKIKERSGRCALKTSISICLSSLQVLCSSPPALCLGPRAKLWAGWLQHWETKDSTGIHCEVQRMNDRKKKQNRKHVFCASYAVFCFNFFFLGTCKGKPVSNKAWLELQEQRAVGEVQVWVTRSISVSLWSWDSWEKQKNQTKNKKPQEPTINTSENTLRSSSAFGSPSR